MGEMILLGESAIVRHRDRTGVILTSSKHSDWPPLPWNFLLLYAGFHADFPVLLIRLLFLSLVIPINSTTTSFLTLFWTFAIAIRYALPWVKLESRLPGRLLPPFGQVRKLLDTRFPYSCDYPSDSFKLGWSARLAVEPHIHGFASRVCLPISLPENRFLYQSLDSLSFGVPALSSPQRDLIYVWSRLYVWSPIGNFGNSAYPLWIYWRNILLAHSKESSWSV
jgi:hypothetical protein